MVSQTGLTLLLVAALPLHVQGTAKSAGDISSVVSRLGDTYQWPEAFAALKERLRPDPSVLQEAWQRLDRALDSELAEIASRQQDVIPSVEFSAIKENGGSLPAQVEAEVRKRGVVIVRGVVDVDTARGWKAGVEHYAQENPSHVGFPREKPQVLELYWSRPQLDARQHPNMQATMLAINRLWAGAEGHVSFDHAFSYSERLRSRPPGKGFSLHPHTDGGSIERFEDPHYQVVYDSLWRGKWEEYDPWAAAGERALANVSMYTSEVANGYCTVFRAFQGWTAISSIGAGPDAGTLRVLPLLREATAYIMLRPFLDDVPPADFCGAVPGMSHDVTPKWHEKLHAGLVSLPAMAPGDTVWWHADLVHAVEALHNGTEDSAVLYIPSLPATVKNAAYVRQQRELFRSGRTPPDFPPNDSEMNFTGRGLETDLTPLGRQMLGFEPLAPTAACSAFSDTCRQLNQTPTEGLLADVNQALGI